MDNRLARHGRCVRGTPHCRFSSNRRPFRIPSRPVRTTCSATPRNLYLKYTIRTESKGNSYWSPIARSTGNRLEHCADAMKLATFGHPFPFDHEQLFIQGKMSPTGSRFFRSLYDRTGGGSGIIPSVKAGTHRGRQHPGKRAGAERRYEPHLQNGRRHRCAESSPRNGAGSLCGERRRQRTQHLSAGRMGD